MPATSGNQLAVGARAGFIFALNAAGLPAATSTTVYEGLELKGLKASDLNVPNPRIITHSGNDRVLANDFLPSLEPITGEVRVANLGMPLAAKVNNVKTYAVGDVTFMPWGTDQQGSEIDVAMMVFQQSLDTDLKQRRYRTIVVPKARAVVLPSGMNENANEQRLSLVSNPSTKHLWGTTLSVATEGATEAAFHEGMATYRPKVVAWLADGTAVDFLFPTNAQSADVTKVTTWKNGVIVSSGLTVTTPKITFGSAPTLNDLIVSLYEY